MNRRGHRTKCTQHVRRQVLIRDDFTCQTCGWQAASPVVDGVRFVWITNEGWVPVWQWSGKRSPAGLSLDHYPIAYTHGGLWIPENLRTLCLPCNTKQGVPV